MSAQTFYNSIRPITTLTGVVATLIAPQAFGSNFPLIQRINPLNQNNPVRMLPNTTVFMTQPPTPHGMGRNPQFSDVIGKAFTRDDLHSLYGSGSFGACETSSRAPSFFEKNYSNFAYSCLEDFKNRQAVSFDERFQADPHTQGVVTAPLGGRLQWAEISASARGRLLQRSIHDLANRNKTLSDIIQGRISFDFGLGNFWSSSAAPTHQNAVRPRFVVDVQQPDASHTLNKRKMLASVGPLTRGSIETSKSWFSSKPQRAKRVLRETFEPTPADVPSLETPTASAFSSESSNGEILSSVKFFSRMAGLQHVPFTKINMRAERRVIEGQNQFALRATESQELFFAEFPDARNASTDTMIWGYKIPWQRHALNVRYDESIQERTTSYSYRVDDSNKTDLSYNHKNNAVSAGFVISF